MRQRRIITHPGQAHRDEFLACCILIAEHGNCRIERVEPLQSDLLDPEVYVVDIGGKHEPEMRNFDHHQLPREHSPTCALSMVLDSFGAYNSAKEIYPWLIPTEIIDSKGPFALAAHVGVDADSLMGLISPIESQLLRMFQQYSVINNLDQIYTIMEFIGRGILDYLEKVTSRLELLIADAQHGEVDGIHYVDASVVGGSQDPTLAVEIYCKRFDDDNQPVVTITRDDRGDGYSLFRRNDDKRIDFSQITNHPIVTFAHANGFIAKTADGIDLASIENLIRLSIVPSTSRADRHREPARQNAE